MLDERDSCFTRNVEAEACDGGCGDVAVDDTVEREEAALDEGGTT